MSINEPTTQIRPSWKPRKYLHVALGDTFTVDDVAKLIEQRFTHYIFPDGASPAVLPIMGFKCQAEKLVYDEYMNQYMWTSLMAADWKPMSEHP